MRQVNGDGRCLPDTVFWSAWWHCFTRAKKSGEIPTGDGSLADGTYTQTTPVSDWSRVPPELAAVSVRHKCAKVANSFHFADVLLPFLVQRCYLVSMSSVEKREKESVSVCVTHCTRVKWWKKRHLVELKQTVCYLLLLGFCLNSRRMHITLMKLNWIDTLLMAREEVRGKESTSVDKVGWGKKLAVRWKGKALGSPPYVLIFITKTQADRISKKTATTDARMGPELSGINCAQCAQRSVQAIN